MTVNKTACCPRCGGTTGFSYNVTFTVKQHRNWDGVGNNDYVGNEWGHKYTMDRCDDCGKVIRDEAATSQHNTKETP